MMFIKDILFCKCGSRQEQIILVIGMAVMVLVCAGVCKFGFGMGQAALETVQESDGAGSRGSGRFVFYGYTIFAISGFLGVVFALMAVINLIRLLTGTGIEDPDEAW